MGACPTTEATPALTRQGGLQAAGLLTDGLTPCLTASLHPAFGWRLSRPESADPAAARQTGYEIAVEDSAGAELWYSGPVPSSRQSEIPYGGPELAEDTDYSWRVRVSDAGGYAGPWSEAEIFSTGLSDSG